MGALNYKDFNQMLYKKRKVGYSFKSQDISKVKTKLPDGFTAERINKDDWGSLEFIRDGSLMTLEDTIVVKRGREFSAFITPHKALIYNQKLKNLAKDYNLPLSFSNIVYLGLLIGFLGIWWFL